MCQVRILVADWLKRPDWRGKSIEWRVRQEWGREAGLGQNARARCDNLSETDEQLEQLNYEKR